MLALPLKFFAWFLQSPAHAMVGLYLLGAVVNFVARYKGPAVFASIVARWPRLAALLLAFKAAFFDPKFVGAIVAAITGDLSKVIAGGKVDPASLATDVARNLSAQGSAQAPEGDSPAAKP
jgi:hypothetical protein